eukprot:gb/GEZN01008335.1/.p1 GENE.gb/GEZN01008335.1/~~gb/GEZN01008335.1/.p1  ORF type:complete len:325 (-),score=17.71 gb/GEZN01008335.1/:346-1320(-)
MYVFGLSQPHSLKIARPCLLTWIFFLLVGGARIPLQSGTFFQKSIDYTVPTKVGVSCILNQFSEVDLLLRQTDEVLSNDTSLKLVMWSETAVNYQWDLLPRSQKLAQKYSVYLAITYALVLNDTDSPNEKNMLTLIGPQGDILFEYQKAHPVVLGVEENVIPGPKVIGLAATTEFGVVGGAICFDFDFPLYITQASREKVDVMLQPSWTWGPLGAWHAHMDRVRAIENGFTLIRCSSGGTSGVYSPFGEALVSSQDSRTGGFSAYVPLGSRQFTFYGVFGNTFAWFCVVFSVLYMCLLLPPCSYFCLSHLAFFLPDKVGVRFLR